MYVRIMVKLSFRQSNSVRSINKTAIKRGPAMWYYM